MPVTLSQQRQAVESARRILLGSPMPRRSEREELAAHLDEAAFTLQRKEITERDLVADRARQVP